MVRGNRVLGATICSVFLFGQACLSASFAQEQSSSGSEGVVSQETSDSDLAAIRAESQAFVAAFNKHDAPAIAALWTEDAEYIDDTGRHFVGRDAIEKGYASFFADSPSVTLRVVIDSIRLLSETTAIEDGRAVADPPPGGAPGISKHTAVHTKVDGKWLMGSVRDTWIETPSAYHNVADLEWLIGTWTAEEHGVKTESVCSWLANKSFVERKYTITHVDGTKTSGVQLIGWNPQDGHVQSWNFSPDGGHVVFLAIPILYLSTESADDAPSRPAAGEQGIAD